MCIDLRRCLFVLCGSYDVKIQLLTLPMTSSVPLGAKLTRVKQPQLSHRQYRLAWNWLTRVMQTTAISPSVSLAMKLTRVSQRQPSHRRYHLAWKWLSRVTQRQLSHRRYHLARKWLTRIEERQLSHHRYHFAWGTHSSVKVLQQPQHKIPTNKRYKCHDNRKVDLGTPARMVTWLSEIVCRMQGKCSESFCPTIQKKKEKKEKKRKKRV